MLNIFQIMGICPMWICLLNKYGLNYIRLAFLSIWKAGDNKPLYLFHNSTELLLIGELSSILLAVDIGFIFR